jgi:serine protease
MRNTCVALAALCVAATLAMAPRSQAATVVTRGSEETGRVIVKFKADSPVLRAQALSATAPETSRAQALGARLGLRMRGGASISDRTQVMFADGISSETLAQRLATQDDIEYAVPDGRERHFSAPNDPLYAAGVVGNGPAVGQWYLRAPAGEVKSSLDVETAWQITTGSPNIVVAVLDTGVRFDHPDLQPVASGGNLLPGYDMISDAVNANDGDGRDADASDPGDWLTQAEISQVGGRFYQCTTSPEDSSWHGTQMSGLIAALTNNGLGMASIGRNVRVLPVRVLGKCGGAQSDIIAAMRWAAGLSVPGVPANPNPARVINLSLGSASPCDAAYQDVVNQVTAAGTVIVVAAGNGTGGYAVTRPANCVGVVAVAAIRHVGTKVGYSNLGPEVAISAPGGNCVNPGLNDPCLYPLLSTWNSGTTTPKDPTYIDSYNYFYGTSLSTPLVAGTVALMLSAQPTLTPYQVRALLQSSARPFPTTGGDTSDGPVAQCTAPRIDIFGNPLPQLECYCTTDTCGAGLLNAGTAVAAASAGFPASGGQAGGLWWAAPAGSESGWGINFANQGNVIFATWFTYDATGKAWWLDDREQTAAAPTLIRDSCLRRARPCPWRT